MWGDTRRWLEDIVARLRVRLTDLVGCHNMLLDANDNLKLADFAGSSIDGSYATDATVNYEIQSRLPGINRPTRKSDIFALGSALYELVTGSPPYTHESSRNIQILYKKEIYEDVSMLPLPGFGPIIAKCWRRGYSDAKEIVRALEGVESRTKHETPQPNALIENFSQLEIAPKQSGQERSAHVQQPPSRRHNHPGRVAETRRRKKRKQEPKWINTIKHWLIRPQMRYQRGMNCY
jgi:serine/threonine protein kinase